MYANPDDIINQLEALDKSSFNNEASRTQVAEAAHSLFLRLESPYARFVRHGYTEVSSQLGCHKDGPLGWTIICRSRS